MLIITCLVIMGILSILYMIGDPSRSFDKLEKIAKEHGGRIVRDRGYPIEGKIVYTTYISYRSYHNRTITRKYHVVV